MASSTSSFRIGDELRVRFEQVAKKTGKGKNRILTEALQEYLDRLSTEFLEEEIHRQSMLVRAFEEKNGTKEEDHWLQHRDERGWT